MASHSDRAVSTSPASRASMARSIVGRDISRSCSSLNHRSAIPTLPRSLTEGTVSDELEEDHLGRVAATWTELEDAGVAARALRVPRGDLLEELVDGELVLAERGERLAAGVQVTALGERDQLLDLGLDRLGLGLRGLDALVLDDLLAEVRQQRLAMRRGAGELVTGLLMPHGEREA